MIKENKVILIDFLFVKKEEDKAKRKKELKII